MELCWDIEATGFLDESNVDYTASPWKLKDHFKIHCIALEDINTGEEFEFVQGDIYKKFKTFLKQKKVTKLIAHHQLGYDLPVVKAALGIDANEFKKWMDSVVESKE